MCVRVTAGLRTQAAGEGREAQVPSLFPEERSGPCLRLCSETRWPFCETDPEPVWDKREDSGRP